MASPIIIDDGGSTRIRQLKDDSTMDGLIGTWSAGAPLFQDQSADAFPTCTVRVHFHDDPSGAQHAVVPVPLNPGDIVAIQSSNGQVANVLYNPAASPMPLHLTITLSNNAGGPNPMVEARHSNRRRRYTVSNANPIQTVTVNPAPGAVPIFNAATNPSVYTMVHFS